MTYLPDNVQSSARARSIKSKFRPVRPGKEDHLKRWTRFFETFPVGPNRSVEFWTEISGNFGWMDRAPRLFANDALLYGIVTSDVDCDLLQSDLCRLESGQYHWQMKFNPSKCKIVTISHKTNVFFGVELEQVDTSSSGRSSRTEPEMLAVVWPAEHFHLYVYGAQISIITDHKPLIGIFSNRKQAPARFERWKLRLMPYDCKLIYRPGKDAENPADFLSRHPCPLHSELQNLAEDYVNYVCTTAVPKGMTLEDIQQTTEVDAEMQTLIKAIETDRWTSPEVQDYKRLKDEFSVYNGVVLRMNRVLIPPTLRSRAVELAHLGHQGIVKTKQLIRVWFPGIDKLTEEKKNCLSCQAATAKSPPPEPLWRTTLPSAPWKEVAADFAGPFLSGNYIMVVVDEFSRFPRVELLTSTSAKAVVPKLDAVFSRQGVPDILKSDNGPPLMGMSSKTLRTI